MTDDDLRSLRATGATAAVAEALTVRANARLNSGLWPGARADLEEAAALHTSLGNSVDVARCTHLAATMARMSKDIPGAKALARKAVTLSAPGTPWRVAAYTELGEIGRVEDDCLAAEQAYANALEDGVRAGMIPSAQATLIRRRAQALVAGGRAQEGAGILSGARRLLEDAGEAHEAVRTGVEEATAWHHANDRPRAVALREATALAAAAIGDEHALGDLELLAVTDALEGEAPELALQAALRARTHALAGNAPLVYMTAALAIARISESLGDRDAAYEALAVGWVTLGDRMGPNVGRSTFEPKLQELATRWGRDAFIAVRDAYTARRRATASG